MLYLRWDGRTEANLQAGSWLNDGRSRSKSTESHRVLVGTDFWEGDPVKGPEQLSMRGRVSVETLIPVNSPQANCLFSLPFSCDHFVWYYAAFGMAFRNFNDLSPIRDTSLPEFFWIAFLSLQSLGYLSCFCDRQTEECTFCLIYLCKTLWCLE